MGEGEAKRIQLALHTLLPRPLSKRGEKKLLFSFRLRLPSPDVIRIRLTAVSLLHGAGAENTHTHKEKN